MRSPLQTWMVTESFYRRLSGACSSAIAKLEPSRSALESWHYITLRLFLPSFFKKIAGSLDRKTVQTV
ncbi:hypothetical protein H6F76_02730 [Leptolyngbya sp. FACHB-321]|uniref:hypothetical protein n=1 Tax=Leptolyngbya sp. FACHB-321 TaxID=2692807 RepID=UPI0019CB0FA8|nr:hypothetical protein [Leptolyngbya sp. FACHB-321]MBD2033965.1 hypothetical protein [Leptolyngbya sp. FACHB-321]